MCLIGYPPEISSQIPEKPAIIALLWLSHLAIRHMKVFSQVFTPTNNRRLNELVGFLLLVSALLLFLAIASYSPLDPSFNTASAPLPSRP